MFYLKKESDVYRFMIVFVFLGFVSIECLAQQLKWSDYENDTLITLGSYILADEKMYIPKDTFIQQNTIGTNIPGVEVVSFMMTAFALGKEFKAEADNNKFTNSMINAVQNTANHYKFVNLKDFRLMNPSGDIYVPRMKKIKIVLTD